MEIGTGLALLGSTVGSAKIIEKLLGPTADYLGAGLKDFAEIRIKNISRIFQKACTKLGDRIENEGSVSPKILRSILNEGSFCDDELSAEYFGGVLASSRSTISRDDRGAALLALISRLSAYQIRAHYILYSVLKKLYDGSEIIMNSYENREKLTTFLPMECFVIGMDFSGAELERLSALNAHVIFGLSRENLIENFIYGQPEYIRERYPSAPSRGIIYQPTSSGSELYLWAHGYDDKNFYGLFDPTKPCKMEHRIDIPEGSMPI